MTEKPAQFRFAREKPGLPGDETWAITHDSISEPTACEVSIRVHYVSVDPGMKGWITNARSYIDAVQPGDVMRGFGVAEVTASAHENFAVGDFCTGFTGIQTHATVTPVMLRKIDPKVAPLSRFLGGLGMTGFTAYFGLLDIGQPKAGDTVVVSSAAGAVGHIVAQIAKLKGCRVVGIAGGPEKCNYLRDELKLDAAIDYRTNNLASDLQAATPDGIDVYFDGVGGETLDTVLGMANRHARIVACGAISGYVDPNGPRGLANYTKVITQSLMIRGFTMVDYMHRIEEAFVDLLTWEHEGKIVFREHILEGIESFPRALQMVLRGENHGKLMIKLTD